MVSLLNLIPKLPTDLLPKLPTRSILQRNSYSENDLIRREAKIGAQLFGPIPAGHRREFFCLDESTWIWHEEWVDVDGNRQEITTRYEIRGNQVIKAQGSQPYQIVTSREAKNLLAAVALYHQRVMSEIYTQQPELV